VAKKKFSFNSVLEKEEEFSSRRVFHQGAIEILESLGFNWVLLFFFLTLIYPL
jgi:hypothetical protein